jgi:hypothetical protein
MTETCHKRVIKLRNKVFCCVWLHKLEIFIYMHNGMGNPKKV